MLKFKKLVEKIETEEGTKIKSYKTSSESVIMNNETTVGDAIGANTVALNLEVQRASGQEKALDEKIDAEIERASASEQSSLGAVEAEKTRAEGAEAANAKAISDEADRAQTAEASVETAAKNYTDKKIADLINGAPSTLDTLKEIADAMAEDKKVVYALNTAIGTKADKEDLTSHATNTTVHVTAAERTAWNAKTSNTGTVTSVAVKMNGSTKGTVTSSGTIDLGTVLTSHQDISGKQDKTTAVTHTASTAVGSATQPVFVNASGVATATTYTLGKSVPSNAVFTDTTALGSMTGTLGLAHGGTGATTAAAARTNLGLGGAATYGATSSVTKGGTSLVTSGAVYDKIASLNNNKVNKNVYSANISTSPIGNLWLTSNGVSATVSNWSSTTRILNTGNDYELIGKVPQGWEPMADYIQIIHFTDTIVGQVIVSPDRSIKIGYTQIGGAYSNIPANQPLYFAFTYTVAIK